ncbi:MAG: aldo/keto reductase [Xanthomonadales bacterium]|jgi:predicted oxidoreductase|nr:aldo/keto reductase [Xanthomonadales bacterium]
MNRTPIPWRSPTSPDGPELSRLVQGYWRMLAWGRNTAEHLDFLKAHVDLGITSVDHADLYGDYEVETCFGEVLAREPALRDQLQIITKCGIQLISEKVPGRRTKHYDTGPSHLQASVERSLERLGTDRLDVVLLHRPDPLMDADAVAETVLRLRDAGKVLHFGVSNFTPAQFALLQSRLPFALATNQVEINPLNPAVLFDGTLDDLQARRVRPMAWSCLGGGRLFDKSDEAGRRCRGVLRRVGEELGGFGVDQVAYAWVLRLPSAPLPILGSGRIDRVRLAVAATAMEMTTEQWFSILEAARGVEVP